MVAKTLVDGSTSMVLHSEYIATRAKASIIASYSISVNHMVLKGQQQHHIILTEIHPVRGSQECCTTCWKPCQRNINPTGLHIWMLWCLHTMWHLIPQLDISHANLCLEIRPKCFVITGWGCCSMTVTSQYPRILRFENKWNYYGLLISADWKASI